MIEYSVNLSGFKTLEAAREFISWFEGQGEQDISVWWEIKQEERPEIGNSPIVDISVPEMIVDRTVHARIEQ